ncbi:MAG: hypothetical protein C0392_14570, partial [Syntrophus sp. (in: bacteria)]|nr:hypothetical protein [Syntrophus sp. (in: bacteria)]
FGTNVTALVATFTTTGTRVNVGAVVQTSGATANDFTAPVAYTVTAADASTVIYTVTVTLAPNPAKAITAYSFVGYGGFAGTINEPAKTIAVTLPFGTNVTNLIATFTTTGTGVTIGAVVQTSGVTANDFTAPVAYTVTAADASTAIYTVTVTLAPNPAKAITAYSFVGYGGFAGTINEPAKTIAVTLPFGTNVTNLIATFTTTGTGVTIGAAVQTSGATANDFTAPVAYTVTAADASTAIYTVTVTLAPNPAKAITAYSFVGYGGFAGTINEVAKTIAVTLPFGTDVTNLIATFTTTGTGVTIGAAVQTSGATANDFTGPLLYTVTAADASTAIYTVTVTLAPNPAKAITAYSFAGVAGTINEPAKTIAVGMPLGTDVTTLVATFTTTGTQVNVGAAVQTSGVTVNNFTAPVAYIVTAADASTVTYTVTVTVTNAPNLGAAAAFGSFGGGAGMTNQGTLTVVNGDIGSTGVSTTITGFRDSTGDEYTVTPLNDGLVTGRIYTDAPPPVIFGPGGPFGGTAATMVIATAGARDARIAYNNLSPASLPGGIDPGAGQLGGLTLAPGIYKSAGATFILTLFDLTLDAAGDPNAVWVFQTAAGLTIGAPGAPRTINLINGAQAKNVFWYVGSAARIENRCNMVGTIIAPAGVTISTAGEALLTTLNGRALGLDASVTVVNTIINVPAP